MQVLPYHSINQADPDVYHIHNNCPSGKQIPPQNKQPGKNGWDLCGTCAKM